MGRKLLFIIPWFFFFVVSPTGAVQGQATVTANFIHNPDRQCADIPVFFDASPSVGTGLTYTWDFDDGSPVITTSHDTITHRFYTFNDVSCSNHKWFYVKLTVTDVNNIADSVVNMVWIVPQPRAALLDSLDHDWIICHDPLNPVFEDTLWLNVWAPLKQCVNWFSINWGDGSDTNYLNLNDFPLYHVYNSYGTFPLHYLVHGVHNCDWDTTYYVKIVSFPSAHIDVTPVDPGCAPYTVQFAFSAYEYNYDSTTYTFDFGDGSPPLSWSFDEMGQYDTLTHTYAQPHCLNPNATSNGYLPSLYITDNGVCGDSTVYAPLVEVYETPTAAFEPDHDSVCFPGSICFSNQTIPGYTYNCQQQATYLWDFGDGTTSTDVNPCHTYAQPGDYIVTLTAYSTDECYDDTSMLVHVYDKPLAMLSVDLYNCQDDSVVFTDLSLPGSGYVAAWLWEFGDGHSSTQQHPTHVYTAPGIYTTTLTVWNSKGCVDDTSITLRVWELPVASFSDSSHCSYTVYFTDHSEPHSAFMSSWYWDFGDGNTSWQQHPVHAYDTAGAYMVSLSVTNSNGCVKTVTYPVFVHPLPVAAFNVDGTCLHYPSRFTDQSVANYGIIDSWEWDFGDGNTSTQQHPNHAYSSPGTYMVRLIIETGIGCRDTAWGLAQVYPLPVVNFTASPICDDYDTYFTDLSIPNAESIVSWYWQFGDGYASYQQHPNHIYAAPGFYDVTLTVENSNGCVADTTLTIEIYSSPAANFYESQPVCFGDTIYFYNTSTPGLDTIVEHFWQFGDGQISYMENPAHLYAAPGHYVVSLTVTNTNGCTSTLTRDVYVHEVPTVDFDYTFPCWINETHFEDLSTLEGSGSIIQWIWDFDDGTITYNQNPVHTFAGPGIYQVSLTAITGMGCSSTFTKAVTIYDGPRAEFVADTFCVGYSIDFLDLSTPQQEIVSWYWDFGDPISGSLNNSTQQHPEHTYNQAGEYTVTLTVTDTNGCFHSNSHTYYIEPNPLALFTYVGAICPYGVVEFYDLSQTYYSDIIRWEWDFGDGSTQVIHAPYSPNTAHVFTTTGSFAVSLSVYTAAGCSNTYYEYVQVHPGPDADFTYENTCEDEETLFFDNTPANDIITWEWDFGDPVTGAANYAFTPNPTHQFSSVGTYTVSMIVMNAMGCADTAIKTIEILPPPPVEFSWLAACEDTITWFFVDSSIVNTNTIIYYNWDFGDGYYSNLANPGHVYDGDGSYNVTLHLTDTAHCENSLTHEVTVYKKPYAFYDITEPTCIGDSIFMNNMSSSVVGYIERWIWNYDDGTPNDTIWFPNDPNVSHIYLQTGSYSPVLTVTNTKGCSDSYSRELIVRPRPEADFTHSYPCENAPVSFTDLSATNGQGNPSTYLWDFGDPASGVYNTSNLQHPKHTFIAGDSTYTISLIIVNFFGCADTMIKTIYVNDGPPVDFSWSDACEDMATTFFPDSSVINVNAVSTWFWDFGDGSFGYEPVIDHEFSLPGTYEVSLTITDSAVCSGIHTKLVTVNPAPLAMFVVPEVHCAGQPILFDDHSTSSTSYITAWHWDFGDGNDTIIYFPGDPDVTHTYNLTGTYAVVLSVLGADACVGTTTEYVSIDDSPEADFNWEGICQGSEFQFYDLSVAPLGTSIVSWSWNFDDPASGVLNTSTMQSPAHIFTESGVHQVSLAVENSAGCYDSIVIPVNVSGGPEADFFYSGNCVNNATSFEVDTTVTNMNNILFFEWDFGDGSPPSGLLNPTHVYTVAGTYTASLTVYDSLGCENIVAHGLTIQPGPVAVFSYDAGCEGELTAFIDYSYNLGNGMITQWHWNFNDPASGASNQSYQQNPVHIFSGPGLYYVSLTVVSAEGCTDNISLPVNVLPAPEANFTAQVNACGQGTVYFYDGSSGQAPIVAWEWTFENGYYSNLANPVHSFSAIGETFPVRLVVTDNMGCTDTIVKEVYIPAELDVRIYAEANCLHQEMQFSAMIIEPQPNSIHSYSWDFGDPASGSANYSYEAEPFHVFSQTGAYIIRLDMVDMFGCEATVFREVRVNELPFPDFSYSVATCDSVFFFEDRTPIGSAEISCWTWDFGDGSPVMTVFAKSGGDVHHTYSEYGVYQVTLSVENIHGCIDTAKQNVVYDDCMVPGFAADDQVCQYADLIIDVSGSVGPVQQWYFDFGDGRDTAYTQAVTSISHRYQQPGNYMLRMGITAVMNGVMITDTLSKPVRVLPAPDAGFATTGSCVGSPVRFTDSSTHNNSWPTAWHWDFGTGNAGDTANGQMPVFTYHEKGFYPVSFRTTNNFGCTDLIEKTLSVGLPPMAAFEFTPGCVDAPVYFTDHSQAAEDPITAWKWNFGDEFSSRDTSRAQNPSWAYSNAEEQLVELVVFSSGGCPDTVRKWINIHPNPMAGFTVETNYDGTQGRVALDDASEGAQAYFWDFGDGFSIYDDYPPVIHDYQQEGTYMVEQVVWNEWGCVDTITKEVEFMLKTLYIPNALNPNSPDPEVQVFRPKGRNLMVYRIGIYNSWGERIWESSALDAEGRPAESWDGTYEGHLVPTDVYVWKAEAIFRDGTIWEGSNTSENNQDELATSTCGLVVVVR